MADETPGRNFLVQHFRKGADEEEVAGAALGAIDHATGSDRKETLKVVSLLVTTLALRRINDDLKREIEARAEAALRAVDTVLTPHDGEVALIVAAMLIRAAAERERTQ